MSGSPIRNALRFLWRIIFYGCILALVSFIGLTLFIGKAFFGYGEREFVEVSGTNAQHRLNQYWPTGVDSSDVLRVSFKESSTIDSHSTWYRIRLSPGAAAAWEDDLHLQSERIYRSRGDHTPGGSEGVRRTIAGPPPLHHQTGTTPTWWIPPAIDFRGLEAMEWHSGACVGRATYSAYDQATDELWIYEYSCQHDELWDRGQVPAGEQFSTTSPSALPGQDQTNAPRQDE